jgi:hypothetical protein
MTPEGETICGAGTCSSEMCPMRLITVKPGMVKQHDFMMGTLG